MKATTSRAFSPSQRASWAEGQPISELMAQALANPDLISLAAGFVDQQTLPVEATRQAFEALFADPQSARAMLQYGTTPGYEPLREQLVERQFVADGVPGGTAARSGQQIVVTAGSNQLLHIVCETLLDAGDVVLCAAPTYLVFLGTLSNIGARSIGIATDPEGMVPEALEETLQHMEGSGELDRVKAIYLVSYFDNPSGITMTLERKAHIVELARRYSKQGHIHVIEDTAYRQLRYQGRDVPSILAVDEDGDTAIVADTFSKSFSPGIRIGWGVLPKHLVGPVCSQKGNIDFGSPNFGQHLMAKVLELKLFDVHVQRICDSYQRKLAAMLEAAERHLRKISGVEWTPPRGGLYVWLRLPPHVDAGPRSRLFDIAVKRGVLYVPGQFCFPQAGEPVQRNTIRLSFGVQSEDKIQLGIEHLADAIAEAC